MFNEIILPTLILILIGGFAWLCFSIFHTYMIVKEILECLNVIKEELYDDDDDE